MNERPQPLRISKRHCKVTRMEVFLWALLIGALFLWTIFVFLLGLAMIRDGLSGMEGT